LLDTVPAVAVKFAVVAPAATVTDAGTVRAALFAERLTEEPPVNAARFSVIVQLEAEPEATEPGEHDRLDTDGGRGVTVTEAVVLPFSVAVMITV